MANDKARLSIIGVSKSQEVEYNEYQTLDLALETDKEAAVPNPAFGIENNAGKASGKEFPDRVTDATIKSIAYPLRFDYMQPHELAFVAAYALGERIAPVPLGQGMYREVYFSKTGVTRTAYPTIGNEELPSFTTGFQMSASEPSVKMLCAGSKINTFSLEATRTDRFPKLSANVVTSGKTKTNLYDELVSALNDAGNLTLSRKAYGGTDADARLKALQKLLVDWDGDGVPDRTIEATAVSNAASPVVTLGDGTTNPLLLPYRAVYSDNGNLIDYSDEAKSVAAGDMPAQLVAAEDYLYFGFRAPISSIFVSMGTVSATVGTMTVEYWNGSAWVAVSNLNDATVATGATLGQNGYISFTEPTGWKKLYFGATGARAPLYWLRISVDTDIVEAATITQVYAENTMTFDEVLRFTSPSTWADVTANANDRNGATVSVALAAADRMYFGSERPFSGQRYDMAVAQANTATLDVEYWNGSAWVTATPIDGTIATGKTLAQDGDITWTLPTAWVKSTLANTGVTVSGVTDKELYWARWVPSADFATGTANSIRLLGKNLQYLAIYRVDEATYLPEMETMPDVLSSESSFIIQRANLIFGGKFENFELQDGYTFGCSLESFTFNYNNNHKDPESCWQGESDGEYADQQLRGTPDATLVVNRRLVDWLQQRGIRAGEAFKVHIDFIGKPVSGTNPTVYYRGRIHLDRVWYEELSISTNDGRYQEAATLRVGESDEHPAVVVVIERQDSVGMAA